VDSPQFVRHERKLTALAALREFFSVSPLWLRAATAFTVLLLCVLGALALSRVWNKPVQLAKEATEPKYNQQDFDRAVQKRVDEISKSNNQGPSSKSTTASTTSKPTTSEKRIQLAVNRVPPRIQRAKGLSRQEREQLASDLRLVPRDDEELPLGLSDEPEQ
jgi:hypothetical protein